MITLPQDSLVPNLSSTVLYDLCEESIKMNLDVLNCSSTVDAIRLLTDRHAAPDRTDKRPLPIAFSVLAFRFFAIATRLLTQDSPVVVFYAPKGNGALEAVRSEARNLLERHEVREEEFLVDYYVCPKKLKLCPLLTMESEADTYAESLEFKDLDKLLAVSSPRRVYFGQVTQAKLGSAEEIIRSRLSVAYQSQLIHRGDQIVIMLNVTGGKSKGIRIYDFDLESRLGLKAYIESPSDVTSSPAESAT
jgi:hypothetical protein